MLRDDKSLKCIRVTTILYRSERKQSKCPPQLDPLIESIQRAPGMKKSGLDKNQRNDIRKNIFLGPLKATVGKHDGKMIKRSLVSRGEALILSNQHFI